MALAPAGDPPRFIGAPDWDMVWFSKRTRIIREREGRWQEWERLKVLERKKEFDEVFRKKKEGDDKEKMEKDDKEKELQQTEAVEVDFKRARTVSWRRVRNVHTMV